MKSGLEQDRFRFASHERETPSGRKPLQHVAVILLALLLLSFTTLQAVHFHLDAAKETTSHCSLCLATQPVAKSSAVTLPQPVAQITAVTLAPGLLAAHRALPVESIRPPPCTSL